MPRPARLAASDGDTVPLPVPMLGL